LFKVLGNAGTVVVAAAKVANIKSANEIISVFLINPTPYG
jgi:hypothetical protein